MALAFSGAQEAWTAVVWMNRSSVEPALDPDLVLAPVDDERHPVVFSFGRQRDVAPAWTSRAPDWISARTTMAYAEVIVAIPGVRPRSASDPSEIFTWLPVLWLDHRPAIALGRLAGLAKSHAQIAWHTRPRGLSVAVTRPARTLVSAEFYEEGLPAPALSIPAIAQSPLPHLIARPLVGRTVLGNWVSTTLEWNLPSARVRSVRGRIALEAGAVSGLGAASCDVNGVGDGALGAYVLEHEWTVTLPRPLGRVARSAAPHVAVHFAKSAGAGR